MCLFELLDDCFLDQGLAVSNTVELGTDGLPADGELAVLGNPASPVKGGTAVEQGAEVGRVELPYFDDDPVGAAQPQIGSADGLWAGSKYHLSIGNRLVLVAEGLQFPGDDRLQPETTRRDQLDVVVQVQSPRSKVQCQESKGLAVFYF